MRARKMIVVYKAAALLGYAPDLIKAKTIADRFTLTELNTIYLRIVNTGRRVKVSMEDLCVGD